MKYYLAALVAAGLATTAAMPAQAHNHAQTAHRCQPVTQQQVEAQFERFNAAWATRSPDQVTALFARDAVLLPTVSNRPRTDHAGIRDYFVTFLRGEPVGQIDTSTVSVGCNMASRVGTWTVRLKDQATGRTNDVRARYSFIYQWENGQWRIAHLHSSMMPETTTQTASH